MSFPFSVFRFPFSVFRFPFSVFRFGRIKPVKVAGRVVRNMYYGRKMGRLCLPGGTHLYPALHTGLITWNPSRVRTFALEELS
ncbi:hypothetical protein BWI97_12520 [Siphonobacter sp. BAB-5405]|nr:hypothetical protein BWI97_12520 [Siphonobacter sp. BAB-5405]